MSWKNSVCMATSASAGLKIEDYVKKINEPTTSAIDNFYGSTSDILVKLDENFFKTHSEYITGLLFIGLISATENYFRDILGFILSICPISRANAAEEKIQLGSILWAPGNSHGRTAFEFMAFSASENITKTFAKFAGYQLKQNFGWHKSLPDYDQLCELRHGIVHSGHILSGKNAIRLKLKPTTNLIKVTVNYKNLQIAGAVCTNMVQAANNELFELLVNRWAKDWRTDLSWDKTDEQVLFERIWKAFRSERDGFNGSITNPIDSNACLDAIRTEFNL